MTLSIGPVLPAVVVGVALAGCAATGTSNPALGPMSYDASGALPCSATAPSFDGACGWRRVNGENGTSEIWISNISTPDEVSFRVLDFAQGEFTSRDGTPLTVSKSGEIWTVSIPGREYYHLSAEVVGN
jgi:hypothetical protein